ncbi:MAG: hypothetical protein ACI4IQ_04865 [Eubacterium sp.]
MIVFTNADFISFDEHDITYSVMVVGGKSIAYVGYSIPLCYRDEKVVDLEGKAVIPIINDKAFVDYKNACCNVLKEGESADFIVLDKNILKYPDAKIVDIYVKGKKKKIK